jgi:hypothetical protein
MINFESCMIGSTFFGQLSKRKVSIETTTLGLLGVAALSLLLSALAMSRWSHNNWSTGIRFLSICGSFFFFEGAVGCYFPSIGSLRSQYLPNSHRSVLMTLFGVPLNVLVVTVFLFISKLGNVGAMGIASAALGIATLCMLRLQQLAERQRQEEAKQRWNEVKTDIKKRFFVTALKDHHQRRSSFHGPEGRRHCREWLEDKLHSSSMAF